MIRLHTLGVLDLRDADGSRRTSELIYRGRGAAPEAISQPLTVLIPPS